MCCIISGVCHLTVVMTVVSYLWSGEANTAMMLSLASGFQLQKSGAGFSLCLPSICDTMSWYLIHYCLQVWTALDCVQMHTSDNHVSIVVLRCLGNDFLMLE